ncbi:MAG: hypothetical protein M3Y41_07535, partial [Pseudomonadota bacterium]|nr:hypothetical protein [Pseudomonadota bacterium]
MDLRLQQPELIERLLREARIGALTYGVTQSVVALTGNAGFGAANNLAVSCCRSDRILIVNPDVFPYDADWAAKHTEVVSRSSERTRLFGVPLYYDDGSLMHGGMYFDTDTGLSVEAARITPRRVARVEHYGKGAPPGTRAFTRTRPVPAVSGAFMSAERSWFEKLGGFSEDYVFGHYEDADLCLKSIDAGALPWLHEIRLWHLEGRGSTRRQLHEGGALVNRWLFSRIWGERIVAELHGPNPPLLATPSRVGAVQSAAADPTAAKKAGRPGAPNATALASRRRPSGPKPRRSRDMRPAKQRRSKSDDTATLRADASPPASGPSDTPAPAPMAEAPAAPVLDYGRDLPRASPAREAPETHRLKVLLVSLFHPELVRGGAQQVCYELFEGLKERDNIEPTLLASIDASLPALYKSGARITG